MSIVEERPLWQLAAACRGFGADGWFPGHGESASGKAVCRRCAVQLQCLEYAIEHHIPEGVWGGMSTRQRRAEMRRRRAAVA